MRETVLHYLQLTRAPAVFTALSNILAAHLIATEGEIQWFELSLLSLSSAALYTSGMVLNDCYDFDEDYQERPKRPLPSGRIPLQNAWRLGWSLMIFGLVVAALVGIIQLLIAVLLASLIILYDGYTKHLIISIAVMAGCRLANWILGLSIGDLNLEHYMVAVPVFFYVGGLTLLSSEESSAKKPIIALISSLIVGIAAMAIIVLIQQTDASHKVLATALVFASCGLIILQVYRTYQDFCPTRIQKTVKTMILGIIPLDALLVLSNGPWWGAIPVVLLLLPGWILSQRMQIS